MAILENAKALTPEDPEIFFRAHKSRLVNLTQVKEIARWFGGRYRLVMKDEESS